MHGCSRPVPAGRLTWHRPLPSGRTQAAGLKPAAAPSMYSSAGRTADSAPSGTGRSAGTPASLCPYPVLGNKLVYQVFRAWNIDEMAAAPV